MSPSIALWRNKLLANWQAKAIAPLEAMSERDRLALLLAGLALVGAADWFVVWPMNQQRDSIVRAALAEAQATSDAAAKAEMDRSQAMAQSKERSRQLDADLAKLGMAQTSGQQLSALLARALQQRDVQVIGLRETAAETVETTSPLTSGAPSTASADASEVAAAPDSLAATKSLFRHRFELRLLGETPSLMAALAALETEVKPLRISHVRMEGAEGKQAQLTLMLVVLSTERVWLSL